MAGSVPAELVTLAHRLADVARPIAARYFRTAVTVDDKTDFADREAESAMRAVLAAQVPEHGVFGEEHGAVRTDADYVWVLDPIDGTKAFITGLPIFGTLIALLHRGKPVLGVIDQPILDERWFGVEGERSTFNGKPIGVRACPALDHAYMYSTAAGLGPCRPGGREFAQALRLRSPRAGDQGRGRPDHRLAGQRTRHRVRRLGAGGRRCRDPSFGIGCVGRLARPARAVDVEPDRIHALVDDVLAIEQAEPAHHRLRGEVVGPGHGKDQL